MEAYTAFAKVYDRFMKNVPYDKWGTFIDNVISKFGISKPSRSEEDVLAQERNLILDMGCGTGILTRILYDKGYDLIGVDLSQEMLDEAYSKCTGENERDIMYICQDMCELDLYSTVGTVISTCDSVNYLLENEEVNKCFEGVHKYLYPGGLFVFDFNTVHKYRDVIGECTIAENDEDCSFIWDNYYDEEDDINEYDLTLFIKENGSDLYERHTETHYQRGYTECEMYDFLNKSGFKIIGMIDESMICDEINVEECIQKIKEYKGDNYARIGVTEDSERIIVLAGK